MKKLIATCYDSSPFAGDQLSLFDIPHLNTTAKKHAYKAVITKIPDSNRDGAVDIFDVETLLKYGDNVITLLEGNGDFRSEECIKLLKEADIAVTNVPFSLFREYIALMEKYEKKYLIIGNQNAITYKEVFPLIKDNKLWIGASIHNGDREFRVPNNYNESKNYRIDEFGNKYVRVRGPRWFTNLDYKQRYEDLILTEKYTPEKYPKYDNYDAINVDKTVDIPYDYEGIMGVSITFLDKYSPEQFEIVGFWNTGVAGENIGAKMCKAVSSGKEITWNGPTVNGKTKYFRILIRKNRFLEENKTN